MYALILNTRICHYIFTKYTHTVSFFNVTKLVSDLVFWLPSFPGRVLACTHFQGTCYRQNIDCLKIRDQRETERGAHLLLRYAHCAFVCISVCTVCCGRYNVGKHFVIAKPNRRLLFARQLIHEKVIEWHFTMFIVSHSTVWFCMFLVGYPQMTELVIPPGRLAQIDRPCVDVP